MISRREKNKNKHKKIIHQNHRTNIKHYIVFIIKALIVISIISVLSFLYIKNFSNVGVITYEERIKSEKIPTSFEGIKIIHFSDLYYGSTIKKQNLKQLVKLINEKKPDILIFTGNLIKPDYKLKNEEIEYIINKLKKIETTIGKYAVNGRHDTDSFNTIMNEGGFTILNNNYDVIYNEDNYPILITGLSSLVKKERDINKAYTNPYQENGDIYKITIMNETDDLDSILENHYSDIVLAGNSLNGQIRIPGIGGIIKKEGSSKYPDRQYKIEKTNIYISSGIGTDDLNIRLFSRPSINFFRLGKK